jgi:pimeloyl-ACP methyl ester carboxylesterase
MKHIMPALIALFLVPIISLAQSSSISFELSPDTVFESSKKLNVTAFSNLNGNRGFIWLAPSNVPAFDQVCLHLGSVTDPIPVTDATVTIYSRGLNFPSGGTNTLVAESEPSAFTVAHINDIREMKPYCVTFNHEVPVIEGEAYVFAINLNSTNTAGRYLTGGPYSSYEVTKTAYSGNVRDTSVWAGLAIPFQLRHTNPTSPAPAVSSVLFLPGLQGSRLYENVLGVENKRWELSVGMSQKDAQALYLNPDGTSAHPIYTKEGSAIGKVDVPFAGFDLYQTFFDKLEELKQEKAIGDYLVFPYDWRMDPIDVVEKGTPYKDGMRFVSKEVERLARLSLSGKVTVIGHSNGGLVAKALLARLEREGRADLVDKVIFLNVPQFGTPQAMSPMLHGDYGALTSYGGLYLSKQHARDLSQYLPDGYALLPSRKYFESNPVVVDLTHAPELQDKIALRSPIVSTYQDFDTFLTGFRSGPSDDSLETPKLLTGALLARSMDTHDALDTWKAPTGVDVVQVVGNGLETMSGMTYEEHTKKKCVLAMFSCENVKVLSHFPTMTLEGDGTVVGMSQAGQDSPTYVIDIARANRDLEKNWRHANITESVPFQQLFPILLSSSTPTHLPEYVGLTASEPSEHLQVRVLSPVSLEAYDNNGRHTGLVKVEGTDLLYKEEDIPNSHYEEFGEAKYLGLPGDADATIALKGLSTGTFTLELARSGGGVTQTIRYTELPTTASTSGEIEILSGDASQAVLRLDLDGNGNVDLTLAAQGESETALGYLKSIKAFVPTLSTGSTTVRQLTAKLTNLENILLGTSAWDQIDDDNDRADVKKGEKIHVRALRKIDKIEAWIARKLANTVPVSQTETLLTMTSRLRTLIH